jgi:hypothetical protein
VITLLTVHCRDKLENQDQWVNVVSSFLFSYYILGLGLASASIMPFFRGRIGIAEASAMIAQQRLEFPTIPTRIFIVVHNLFKDAETIVVDGVKIYIWTGKK